MKRFYLITMLLCLCAIGAQAQTQDRPFTNGPVWRITYYKIKPGKGTEYIKYIREHSVPIYDEEKRQGLILDYKYFSQPTNDGTSDWDIAFGVSFSNYAAALDYDAEKSKKAMEISLKHHGSAEARTKAIEQRNQMRDMVASQLIREEKANPIK